VSLRDDGPEVLEWAARYLDRVGELPVLAQVEPGYVRSRLPASAPEQGEPFSAVLRDVEEVLLPAMTHWQSPRFFAYFAISSSEPAILAELLAATLNQNAILWRTSPASTELEQVVAGWVAELLGLPEDWHGHIEDTASTSTLAALIAAREVNAGHVVVCSEHAHSSIDKAAKMLGLELRKTPVDQEFRLRVDALDLSDATAVVATVGTTSTASVDPVAEIARKCKRAGVWLHVDAAYAGSAMVCPEHRWAFEGSSVPTRCSSIRTSGCSCRWIARCSIHAGPRRCAWPSALSPSTCGRRRQSTGWRISAQRSAAASARSSCGQCCAATGARDYSG
jgi:aromatic-L-amino-acid decarboxylase